MLAAQAMWIEPWSTYNLTDDTFIIPHENAVLLISPYENNLLYTSVGASIALFVLFVLLSTSVQRRSIVFYVNILSFVLLASTCVVVLFFSREQERAFNRGPGKEHGISEDIYCLNISFIMEKVTCLVADLALFFKLWQYHPSALYSIRRRWIRLAPLVVLSPPRVVLIFIFWWYSTMDKFTLASKVNLAEFALQTTYCLYATALLLAISVAFFQKTTKREDSRLSRELRLLIESILCTFLVPLLFQIICLVILSVYDNPWLHHFRFFSSCNTFTTVQSALLSTSWSTIRGFDDEESDSPRLTLVSCLFPDHDTAEKTEEVMADIPLGKITSTPPFETEPNLNGAQAEEEGQHDFIAMLQMADKESHVKK